MKKNRKLGAPPSLYRVTQGRCARSRCEKTNLSTSRAFMTLTGKETKTGGPIDYLSSEQRPGANHCGLSIDMTSAAFFTHGRHKRTTTVRVTDRGVCSTPPAVATKKARANTL